MVDGKRRGPRGRGRKRKGLKFVEIAAELVHNGLSLKELAGLTDLQICWLYFRPRDKYGRLKRKGRHRATKVSAPKTKDWQKQSYEGMYRHVWKERGLSDEQIAEKWQAKLSAEPSLRKWIKRTTKRIWR